jgi:RNA polymerase sigma factor (sigma-70 family)
MEATTPTVARLCETFLPLAVRYALPWCAKYPHLATELKSRAAYALFRAAESYVAQGAAFWSRMRFPLWLKIAVENGAKAEIDREESHHRCHRSRKLRRERERLRQDEPPAEVVMGEGEQLDADLERVVGLLGFIDPDDAELVLRYYIDGVPVAELAREAGRPHSTIHTRLTRAVQRLRLAAVTETKT